MGGPKGGGAPAPDYTPVATANREAAELSATVSREQLAWAKEVWAADRKLTQKFVDIMLPAAEREAKAGEENRARYKNVFQPIEDELVAEAATYNSAGRQEQTAGQAQADVALAFDSQRKGALARLESYGVDPSTARAGALDQSARVAEAAAGAGAANAARVQTENIGRALRGEAINIGKGYPGNVAGAYQTAQNSGGGAVQANLATTASGANTMGTGVQWSGQQGQFLGNWGRNIDGQAAVYAADQKAAADESAGTGSIIGGVLGLVGKLATGGVIPPSDRRLKREIQRIGTADNGLPLYTFKYIGGDMVHVGVMAQDVIKVRPAAVHTNAHGFMSVDYAAALA